jgi:hypothetical protein
LRFFHDYYVPSDPETRESKQTGERSGQENNGRIHDPTVCNNATTTELPYTLAFFFRPGLVHRTGDKNTVSEFL